MSKKIFPYILVNRLVKQKKLTKRFAEGIIRYLGTDNLNLDEIIDTYNQELGWDKILARPILRFMHQALFSAPKEQVTEYSQYKEFLQGVEDSYVLYLLHNMRTKLRFIRLIYQDKTQMEEIELEGQLSSACYSNALWIQGDYLSCLLHEYINNPDPMLLAYIKLVVEQNVVKYNYYRILLESVEGITLPQELDDMLTPYLVMAKLVE